jgi:hypothetical protein
MKRCRSYLGEILPGTTTESCSAVDSVCSFLRFAGGGRMSRNFDVVAGCSLAAIGGGPMSCV